MGARLYAALLTIAILALFLAGWWRIYGRPIPVVGDLIHVPVLAVIGAAVAGLLGFRPHRTPYVFGVLTMVLALIGLWLASPIAARWMGNLLGANYFGSSARTLFGFPVLLLPIGWMLLGRSVSSWRLAAATYLIPGVALVVGGFAIGFFGPPGFGPGQMQLWVPFYFLFEWPLIIFIAIGVFGYAFD